ncbi:MAG: T9SS type A sorting domain-containing protein [Runella sp.]
MRVYLYFVFLIFYSLGTFAQTTPTITTQSLPSTSVCEGTNVSVNFTATNVPNLSQRLFTVQLSNPQGTFTNPLNLATGRSSPIVVTLPTTVLGGDYRLRVIADTVGITYIPSGVFTLLKRPTAHLIGDTTIQVGGTATLSIFFSGNGPWTYTFTNANAGTTSSNPLRGIVQPTTTTTYTLQSVSNICGAGTVSGGARVRVQPRITTTFATSSVCAGATTTVPFTLLGAFDTTGIVFTAQLSDIRGSFAAPISIGQGNQSPIAVRFPPNIVAANGYRVRVIANAPSSIIESSPFEIRPLPTASISGTTTITAGESATLQLDFTGDAPWTYTLSNQQTATVSSTPTLLTVSPMTTTNYSVTSIRNNCGTGQTSSSIATVTVIPRISTAEVALGSVCVGANVSVPFVVTGFFAGPPTFTVQLSDAQGSFSNPRNLNSGNSSPINVSIASVPAGTGYRLRVVANANATVVPSAAFTIRGRPTATLSGSSTINFGETATLSLQFTGDSPWSFTLSDGTTGTADRSPFPVNVRPNQTTVYALTSVRNLCGEGSSTGSATVTVMPRVLTENPASVVCSGRPIEIRFSVGGVLPTGTIFQAQLSDSLGNFVNPILIGTGTSSPLTANIPASIASGGRYRWRVIIADNPNIVAIASTQFSVGRRPVATLSGGGNFPLRPGDEILLVIQFAGDAPWTYTLSDNTTGTTSSSPMILTANPLIPTTYTLKSVTNICGEGSVSGSVFANVIITNIENNPSPTLLAFPNPFTERLHIKILDSQASAWQLVDVNGKVVLQNSLLPPTEYLETVDTKQWPSGRYWLRIKIGDRWIGRPLLKQ